MVDMMLDIRSNLSELVISFTDQNALEQTEGNDEDLVNEDGVR